MSVNAHYMVLFKNPRDISQFANLARQMYPKTSQFVVDLLAEQDEELRLRTNIFPGQTHYVYVPRV